VEAGARGDVLIDVAAFGRFADVDRFFRQVRAVGAPDRRGEPHPLATSET